MIEISLNNIKKSFGFKDLLNGFSMEIQTGDRVSLIGENGCGKTTLLNIISKKETIDSGDIAIRNSATIGYLHQQPEIIYQDKLVKEVLEESFEDIFEVEKQLKKLEEKMTNNPNDMSIINKYVTIQEKFMALGGYEKNTQLEKVSHGLHIDHLLEKEFSLLSGGEQKRVVLASIMLRKPSILLLDEPTNHLDIKTLEWLEDYLNRYNGTIIIVSHDRYFLDQTTTKTILVENGKAIVFHGNYSKYLEENEARVEREFKEYKDQQKMIQAMKKKIKQLEEFGKLAYPNGEGFFRRAENIRKRLERLEIKEKPVEKKELPLTFEQDSRSGRDALSLLHYNCSIGDKLLIKDIYFTIHYGEKVCLIGDNGCGKTTLIKRIMSREEKPIRIGSNVKFGYIPQQIHFEKDETIYDYARHFFIGEESHLRSALTKFQFFGDNIFKKVSTLSGGEKVRLKLFALIQEKCNFIILDEPTNHIDITTKEALEEALLDFDGTLLFVSHDRYFINKLANKVLVVEDQRMKEYVGNYDDYSCYNKNRM